MRKFNFVTGEFEKEDVKCDLCGNIIESSMGIRVGYVDNEDGERIKVNMGSCCVGKIRAFDGLSKRARDAYRSQGQIPDEVLRKMPKAPPPDSKSNANAGKEVHKFIEKIGRSVLKK